MIPIDQDFIVCYYCNQHIKIKHPLDVIGAAEYTTPEAQELYECTNCLNIIYCVTYYYNPHFNDSLTHIEPVDIEVRHMRIKVKGNIILFISAHDSWAPTLTTLDDVVYKFNKSDKPKFLQYPLPKLINKMNKLLAFI